MPTTRAQKKMAADPAQCQVDPSRTMEQVNNEIQQWKELAERAAVSTSRQEGWLLDAQLREAQCKAGLAHSVRELELLERAEPPKRPASKRRPQKI